MGAGHSLHYSGLANSDVATRTVEWTGSPVALSVAVEPVVFDDPTITHCSFIHMAEFFRECVACVVVGSEIDAEYTESSGVAW